LSRGTLDPVRPLYQVPKTDPNETDNAVSPLRLSGVYANDTSRVTRYHDGAKPFYRFSFVIVSFRASRVSRARQGAP
jgi:hypothetical protein